MRGPQQPRRCGARGRDVQNGSFAACCCCFSAPSAHRTEERPLEEGMLGRPWDSFLIGLGEEPSVRVLTMGGKKGCSMKPRKKAPPVTASKWVGTPGSVGGSVKKGLAAKRKGSIHESYLGLPIGIPERLPCWLPTVLGTPTAIYQVAPISKHAGGGRTELGQGDGFIITGKTFVKRLSQKKTFPLEVCSTKSSINGGLSSRPPHTLTARSYTSALSSLPLP